MNLQLRGKTQPGLDGSLMNDPMVRLLAMADSRGFNQMGGTPDVEVLVNGVTSAEVNPRPWTEARNVDDDWTVDPEHRFEAILVWSAVNREPGNPPAHWRAGGQLGLGSFDALEQAFAMFLEGFTAATAQPAKPELGLALEELRVVWFDQRPYLPLNALDLGTIDAFLTFAAEAAKNPDPPKSAIRVGLEWFGRKVDVFIDSAASAAGRTVGVAGGVTAVGVAGAMVSPDIHALAQAIAHAIQAAS